MQGIGPWGLGLRNTGLANVVSISTCTQTSHDKRIMLDLSNKKSCFSWCGRYKRRFLISCRPKLRNVVLWCLGVLVLITSEFVVVATMVLPYLVHFFPIVCVGNVLPYLFFPSVCSGLSVFITYSLRSVLVFLPSFTSSAAIAVTAGRWF